MRRRVAAVAVAAEQPLPPVRIRPPAPLAVARLLPVAPRPRQVVPPGDGVVVAPGAAVLRLRLQVG